MNRLSLILSLIVLASPVLAAETVGLVDDNCPASKEASGDRDDDDRGHKALAAKDKPAATEQRASTPALRSRPGWRGFLPGMMR